MANPKDGDATEYAKLVAEAEAAVGAVKDPELKRSAFEKILATLLERSHSTSRKKSSTSKATPRKAAAATNGTSKKSRKGPMAIIEEMIEDGFFESPKSIAQVKAELANRGHHIPLTSLSGPLQSLTQKRSLRRSKVSADRKGAKSTFAYSNW